MAISHAKSNTIPDFTGTVTVFDSLGITQTANATNLVRPSDWNSAHKINYALGGNTAGSASVSGMDVALFGGNNITLSADTANSRLYFSGADTTQFLTTAAFSTHTHALNEITNPTADAFIFMNTRQFQMQWGSNASAFTTNSTRQGLFELDIAGAFTYPNVDAVHIHQTANDPVASMDLVHLEAVGTVVNPLNIIAGGSTGMAINKPIYFQNGASVPMVLGTSQSNSVANLNANYLQGKVSSEFQSTGAYLTTAAQINHSHAFATTTTNGSQIVVGTSDSNGVTIGVPPFVTAAAGGGDGYNIIGVNGGATQLSTTYQLSNANNVTFGLNAGTITASASYAAQTVDTNKAGVGYTSTTQAGIIVGATHNTAGLSMAWPPFLTTAQAPGAYLTTARASNDAIGLNTALTANGVAWTVNSSGLSLNVPAFLTTAANSTHSHGNPTLALTNLTGTTASNSAGFTLSLSAGAAGVVNQTGPNIAVAGQTVTAGTVYFSNSPTVTFGMDGASNITASAAGGGGGAGTIGGWEPLPANNASTFSSLGQNSLYFQKLAPEVNYSCNNFELRVSGSFASSSIAATVNHTIQYGLYSLNTANNSWSSLGTSSMAIQATYSSNLSMGYTVNQGAGSFTTSSAGTVIASLMSGFKHLYLPFTTTLTAGGNYAFGVLVSSGSTGGTGCNRIAVWNQSVINNLTVGKVYASTLLASNASYVGDYNQGVYGTTTGAMPAAVAQSQLTNAISQQRLYLQLEV